MGAWEKFQLGWLNYEVARAGETSDHKLGPMEFNTKQAQGLFVILPQKPVTDAHRAIRTRAATSTSAARRTTSTTR